jgi:hypothetical protein
VDLTDAQWAVLEPTFRPRRRPDGRGRVSVMYRGNSVDPLTEVSESEETFHGSEYKEGVVAWSSILFVVFRILLGAHLVAF